MKKYLIGLCALFTMIFGFLVLHDFNNVIIFNYL